ncbi:MAG: hypothetical protein IMW91_10210 [Firmicutes bacterium]|nr:hypothetical protein [Bacillota bacterium]
MTMEVTDGPAFWLRLALRAGAAIAITILLLGLQLGWWHPPQSVSPSPSLPPPPPAAAIRQPPPAWVEAAKSLGKATGRWTAIAFARAGEGVGIWIVHLFTAQP